MAESRRCTKCERDLPLAAFAKDARRQSGVRAACRTCDASARADRRRPAGGKPGALVLVPKFPDPPAAAGPTVELPAAPGPGPAAGSDFLRHGAGVYLRGDGLPGRSVPTERRTATYADAAEAFIGALVPPAGPADALLVRSLRGLAELLDIAELGTGEWIVRDTTALVAKLVAVQRELAATRAAKGKAAAEPAKPASRLASGQF